MSVAHVTKLVQAHALPATDVLAELGSSPDGLSAADADRRLAEVGPNRLPEPARDSAIKRFLRHFDDILIYILLASAVLKAIMGDWIDFWVIVAVAVINAVIGYVQEGQADKALEGIRKMLSVQAQVRRDGQWVFVDADALVPGDVIRLKSGDRVPADVRLLDAVNLLVEESALTGEAVPSAKEVDPVPPDAGLGDRSSMAFSGTLVAAGRGVGVVTGTGSATEIGRIQQMISEVDSLDTPLTRQIEAFGKTLSVIILAMAAVMIVVGKVFHDFTTNELVSAAIGFAVAAIPEGLPALVTITLALGVQQMARRHAITRRLPAVETLGSVTTVCSDKTGTLTKNEMTVRDVVTAGGHYEVTGLGYAPEGEIGAGGQPVRPAAEPVLDRLVEVMVVCNDSRVVPDESGRWMVVGEPTEGALRTLGKKAGFDLAGYERLAVVPFESANKFMATLNRAPDGELLLLVKGAPDRLLDRSDTDLDASGAQRPLDRAMWEQQIDELSSQGLRVLAAAYREPAPPFAELRTGSAQGPDGQARGPGLDVADLEGLTFVGLVGIVDPPRPEAIDAIATCHRAGVRVKMITGDHAGTASAISREMGIIPPGTMTAAAVTGAELEKASDAQLREIVRHTDTFARTSPEHKLRIVKALQANGEVVAMTGDGVNDAPALKRADVGVAMGIKGTEATKEAAELVLADDNFTSIEHAIEEGRRIYDNLVKSIVFLLPTNGAQSLVILVAVLFGLTLPLEPTQILWVNMITAVSLSLSLAFEPVEPGLMDRPPRTPGGSIVSGRHLWRIAFASLLIGGATLAVFYYEQAQGLDVDTGQTMAVNMLVFGQVAFLFNCRFLDQSSLRRGIFSGNRVLPLSVLVLLVLQVVFVYAPFMHAWFGSEAVGAREWLVPMAAGVVIFALVEGFKAAERRVVGARSRTIA